MKLFCFPGLMLFIGPLLVEGYIVDNSTKHFVRDVGVFRLGEEFVAKVGRYILLKGRLSIILIYIGLIRQAIDLANKLVDIYFLIYWVIYYGAEFLANL